MQRIYVGSGDGQRLDLYLATKLEDLSRTYINRLIKDRFIYVNDKEVKPSYIVKEGDLIQIKKPTVKKIELIPENIPIEIIYEDKDIVLVNKPENMIVHPVKDNYSGTLVNALLYHIGRSSLSNSDIRPGIVHRLDKDTTGLLVIAKNDRAYSKLSEQFIERTVKRIYITLVHGEPDMEEALIDAPIARDPVNRTRMKVVNKGGRRAITHYNVLERFNGYTLLKVSLKTGRTHQIRVHMDYVGYPIVGDPIYTNRTNAFNVSAQLLHAGKLGFCHPGNGNYMKFEVGPHRRFSRIIELLRRR
ncbi:MAG TPA: RluA family pseudouridine synthase [Tepidimicrobium sp.]|nr:RluA family pseudouridine synthase [Tepidimicrobium sp.]